MEVTFSNKKISIGGNRTLVPKKHVGIAVCEFTISSKNPEMVGTLTAQLGDHSATAEVFTEPPKGTGIKIKLENVDYNQRYRWRQNVLEIAAGHSSLKRYLGTKSENFPGQDSRHFRLLVAEIVAGAVCAKKIERREANFEYEDESPDWHFYYAEYMLRDSGVKPLRLPANSPNLNAYAESFVLSIRGECLDRFVPLSERHLRTAVTEYVVHYHTERNHQGLGNELITPLPASANDAGPIVSRERLGGILNYYCRAA